MSMVCNVDEILTIYLLYKLFNIIHLQPAALIIMFLNLMFSLARLFAISPTYLLACLKPKTTSFITGKGIFKDDRTILNTPGTKIPIFEDETSINTV